MAGRIGAETRQVDDRQLLHESGKGFAARADEQVADKQRMPGKLRDDARRQRIFRIGAADQVLHIERLCGRMSQHVQSPNVRSEEPTSELPSLLRTSYAVFCLKKKTT